jgi:hypothetical protein
MDQESCGKICQATIDLIEHEEMSILDAGEFHD